MTRRTMEKTVGTYKEAEALLRAWATRVFTRDSYPEFGIDPHGEAQWNVHVEYDPNAPAAETMEALARNYSERIDEVPSETELTEAHLRFRASQIADEEAMNAERDIDSIPDGATRSSEDPCRAEATEDAGGWTEQINKLVLDHLRRNLTTEWRDTTELTGWIHMQHILQYECPPDIEAKQRKPGGPWFARLRKV